MRVRTWLCRVLWVAAIAACSSDTGAAGEAPGGAGSGGATGDPTVPAADEPAADDGQTPGSAPDGQAPSDEAPSGEDPASETPPGDDPMDDLAPGSDEQDEAPADPASDPPAVTECFGTELPPRAVRGAFDRREPPPDLESYWPTEQWRSAEPAELGVDPAMLEEAIQYSTDTSSTQAVLVVRHGYLVAETYFGGQSASSRHESYSMAKSVSSALVGILIDQGAIDGTDEALCQYYDEWSCDASDPHSAITIDHAMNVATGLEWHEDWRSDATGTNDVFRALGGMLPYVLGRPVVDEPGTVMRYSTGDPALLTGAIQQTTGQTAYEFALEHLFGPLGIESASWNTDSRGYTTTYAGLQATAREYAKFGYLFLREGRWDGEQIVSSDWVAHTTQGDDPCNDWYRYLWHQNLPQRLGVQDPDCEGLGGCEPLEWANLPPDGYFAEGINGQFIFVVPSADLVVVRLAQDGGGSEHWDDYAREFLTRIIDSLE